MNCKHGMSRGKSSEYRAWQNMKDRCLNPRSKSYRLYGGRGISFAKEWDRFEIFYLEMGAKPSPLHSLDRANPDGNYEKGNCRWATPATQSRNVRPRNKFRLAGITVAPNGNYRVFINANRKIRGLGTTPDFFEACCLRKRAEMLYWNGANNTNGVV